MTLMRIICMISLLITVIGCATIPKSRVQRPYPWICYYGTIPSRFTMQGIKLAILDPDNVPDVRRFAKQGTHCIGYVSLGEAEDYRFYWKDIKGSDFIIEENENWEGNYYIDPRSDEWKDMFINRLIPKVLNRGYDGLFLDTLDTAEYLEWKYPGRFAGSVNAMVGLVRAIRERYPDIIIVSNNGYPILYDIAPYIDVALVEDLYTTYDFDKKTYGLQDPAETEDNRRLLSDISRRFDIPILTLDYVQPGDSERKHMIEQRSRRDGFYPYIADIDLKNLPEQIRREDK